VVLVGEAVPLAEEPDWLPVAVAEDDEDAEAIAVYSLSVCSAILCPSQCDLPIEMPAFWQTLLKPLRAA